MLLRVFDAVFSELDLNTSWAANKPFAQLATPSTVAAAIIGIELYQRNVEANLQLGVRVTRRSAATTLASSLTPSNRSPFNTASLCVGGTTATAYGISGAEGAADTGVNLYDRTFGFNQLNGWYYRFPEPLYLAPSKWLTLCLTEASAASSDEWCGCISFIEL